MAIFEYGLRGARGAVIAAGGERVSREQFRDYSLTRDIAQEFCGALGFGFIRKVEVADEAAFVARQRAAGRPNFRVLQLSPQAGERFVIDDVEPEATNAKAIGLDIASDPVRRLAAQRRDLMGTSPIAYRTPFEEAAATLYSAAVSIVSSTLPSSGTGRSCHSPAQASRATGMDLDVGVLERRARRPSGTSGLVSG